MLKLKCMRLENSGMFDYAIKNGKTFKNKGVVLIAAAVPQEKFSRLGFIIRKSTGKAVVRNRIRRILRRVFQEHLSHLKGSYWMIFNIPNGPLQVSLKELRRSAKSLLMKIDH